MKEFAAGAAQRLAQQPAVRVLGQRLAPRAKVTMGTVAELEARLGVRGGQAKQHLARVQTHAGKRATNAVRGVQCNRQSNPYCFIFRYSVVRPMPRSWAALAFSPPVAASALPMVCFSLSGMEMTGDLGAQSKRGKSSGFPDSST